MYLARVRSAGGPPLLAAAVEANLLLPLYRLDITADDPVTVLGALGGAAELASRIRAANVAPHWLLHADEVTFEPPVPRPQKIVCVALNYLAHAEEGQQAVPEEPVIFFKPPSSLIGHGQTVRCPARSQRLDYEVELAVVIGKTCRDVAAADWREAVLGYSVLNDVTARDMQMVAIEKNQPWDHSKGFDTFAPCGPYLVTADDVDDPGQLDLTLTVEGEVRQQSNTRNMLFSIPRLIEVISAGITLEPGDIIATGTPSGIGPVGDRQVMVATVAGIGSLRNPVQYDRKLVDVA